MPAPELLSLIGACSKSYPFLLESAASGPLSRCSLLLHSTGERLQLDQDGQLNGPGTGDRFLDRLDQWFTAEKVMPQTEWPFIGGWFVYLSYELAGEIEPVLDLKADPGGLPIAFAERCDGAVIIEHGAPAKAWIVAENKAALEQISNDISSGKPLPGPTTTGLEGVQVLPDSDQRFIDGVERVQQYLTQGDVFQVNLSRSWTINYPENPDPIALYQRLHESNPAPFGGLVHFDGKVLMSSSPERLVEVRGDMIQTRPIAGTYPRGADQKSDSELSENLLKHPKEQAEHIMLIDLERNDLGRVCNTGSVEVTELMVLESYAHVHHIVSNVKGQLRPDATPGEVIAAVFPGGTITGCPKVRCMQIISELETEGRGFYTGSMGYLSRDGQMDFNILIRSFLLDGSKVTLRTGAGIVADSVPEKELAETVAKARGMMLALEPGHA